MMLMMRAIFFSLALSLSLCVAAAAPAARIDDLGSSSTLCVQKASTQAYDGVVALQDGSGRLICWNKNGGQAWLATIDTGSGSPVLRVVDKPFLDLGSRVSQDVARGRGFAGVAVHSSGRLFVSYYTTVAPNDSAFLVVEELLHSSESWNGYTTRVFSMALPQVAVEPPFGSDFALDYYGGQIMFRPTDTDPFLYLVTGPVQLQAKILRFGTPSGNGTNTPMEAHVYAVGFGVPRRCAFDPDKPRDLYCATVKDDQEHVYLISDPDAPSYSATPPSPSLLVANQRPAPGTPPSLVGGLLYRGYGDRSMTGSYIYMDRSEFWVMEASLARTTRNLRVTCSASAPSTTTSPCQAGDFAGGTITSFGEDADKNALLLATDGVYLVVGPTLCDKAQPPKPTSNLLKWIFGVAGSLLIACLGGYVAYKKCSCCNWITVNAHDSNVNINSSKGSNNTGRKSDAQEIKLQ